MDEDAEVSEVDETNNEIIGSVAVTERLSPVGFTHVLFVGAAIVVAVLGLYFGAPYTATPMSLLGLLLYLGLGFQCLTEGALSPGHPRWALALQHPIQA